MKNDLTGLRFGRWTVVSKSHIRKHRLISYECECDCGTKRIVPGSLMRSGASMSCGCAFVEGAANSQRTHGLTKHRLWGTWRSMKERCYNKNHESFSRYGGRGITVCERWLDPALFILDNDALALPDRTLDRKNNDGNYEPNNCHWVDRATQSRNRSNNRIVEFKGQRMTVSEWANKLGIRRNALDNRLAKWPLELALTLPVIPANKRRASV